MMSVYSPKDVTRTKGHHDTQAYWPIYRAQQMSNQSGPIISGYKTLSRDTDRVTLVRRSLMTTAVARFPRENLAFSIYKMVLSLYVHLSYICYFFRPNALLLPSFVPSLPQGWGGLGISRRWQRRALRRSTGLHRASHIHCIGCIN